MNWRVSMAKNRWFKFFPSDFLTGVRNLNPIEITTYMIVLCELYDHEGTCRRDDEEMATACRIRRGDFTRALDSLIAKGKLGLSFGMLTNKRVSGEIENRTKAAAEKARQRHGHDMATTWPRHEQPEKPNQNNGSSLDVRAYKEERIKKESSSFDVGALPLPATASATERSKRALEEFHNRQRQRQEKIQ